MSVSKLALNLFGRKNVLRATGVPSGSLSVVFPKRGLGTAQPDIEKKSNPDERWNKAVAEAEKLVGYNNSFVGLRWLVSEEVENIAIHIRKMKDSKHPLVATIKELINNANNKKQTWGLVILLVSKALGHNSKIPVAREEESAGYLHSQRALAEIAEMIRTSHIVHKGLMNLPKGALGQQLDSIVSGNKIALLCGDHLLSTSCLELANLRNQDLVELISTAVRDLSESGFIGLRDDQNNPLPARPRLNASSCFELPKNPLDAVKPEDALGVAKAEWTLRNVLEGGNLLGKSCQGTLILAGHSLTTQLEAYHFGLNLALAWQASSDLQCFSPGYNTPFSLVSAPVLFALQHVPELYEEIEKGKRNVLDVDYEKIREVVHSGPGLESTRELLTEHCNSAYEFLEKLPYSESRGALESIVARISGK